MSDHLNTCEADRPQASTPSLLFAAELLELAQVALHSERRPHLADQRRPEISLSKHGN